MAHSFLGVLSEATRWRLPHLVDRSRKPTSRALKWQDYLRVLRSDVGLTLGQVVAEVDLCGRQSSLVNFAEWYRLAGFGCSRNAALLRKAECTGLLLCLQCVLRWCLLRFHGRRLVILPAIFGVQAGFHVDVRVQVRFK